MSASDVLYRLLLAAFLGVVGQLLRVVVGLKKESDTATASNQLFKTLFNGRELWTSLAIAVAVGAVAGVLSVFVKSGNLSNPNFTDPQVLLAFMAAGYSGTDFIEGFMKKQLPPTTPPAAANPTMPSAAPNPTTTLANPPN